MLKISNKKLLKTQETLLIESDSTPIDTNDSPKCDAADLINIQ